MTDEITRIARCVDVTDVGVLLAEDEEARAEIVKLKQEVAELHAAIERIDAAVGDMLKDHDGNYSPTLKHWPDTWAWGPATEACICDQERKRLRDSTAAGWRCPLHGDCVERVSW